MVALRWTNVLLVLFNFVNYFINSILLNNTKKKNLRLALWEGWVSIIFNTLLFAVKYWAGVVSGSLALLADAWHTLSDTISSIVVIVGAKISAKPADEEHPFGHGRADLISSVIIGVLLAVIAFNFIVESIKKLSGHEGAYYGTIAIVVTIVSIVVKELMARFSYWTAKKTGNPSLKADGWHHRSDAVSSVVILIGIFVGKHWWWVDAAMSIVVSILIFYAAYEVIRKGANPLLGEIPEEETLEKLDAIATEVAGQNTYLHHVHVHRYGDHIEITLHIRLPKDFSLEKAHLIATGLERKIDEEMNMEATIHMEPL